MIRWMLTLMALVLVACGDGDSLSNTQSSFTDEWFGGDVAPGSASTEPPGSVAQPYDGNEDEIYDDDLFTHEAFIYGEAQVSPGTSFDGMSEFWILHYPEDGDEEVLCQATWTLSAVESVPACEGCSFAFLVRYVDITIVTDVASSCEVGGFTVAEYDGEEFTFAYRDEQLLELLDGEWVVAGEASYTASNSTLEYYLEGSY